MSQAQIIAKQADALRPGDIVQITNEAHHWFPCLIVVREPKSFGCMGYTVIPTNTDERNGAAYIRLNSADYEPIGARVIFDVGPAEEAEGQS